MAQKHAAHAKETGKSADELAVVRFPIVVILMVLALVAGILLGGFVTGGGAGRLPFLSSASSLSESQLDDTVATYTVGGKRNKVTYRDAILENGSLSAAENSDGSYRIPSADSVLATARSRVIAAEAERQGIEVDDAKVNAYATATFGTTDMSSISSAYGMEQDAAAVLLREATLMSLLRDRALENKAGEAPEAPTEPTEGNEVAMTKEYADYIIALVGKEWDSSAGSWASNDGPFATALSDYEISSSGATYEAACQAYYIAYQQHVSALSQYSAEWTDYVNGLLNDVSINISTIGI